jgi:hypothetical protein
MKKKIIIISTICIPLLMLIGLGFTDGHNTNLKYLMWKWGWTDYSPEICMRYMSCDGHFQTSLEGKTKTEIRKWFPDLRLETNPDQYLDARKPFFIDVPDFLWIGDTQWAIGFENNRVKGFYLIKGNPRLDDRKLFQPAHRADLV